MNNLLILKSISVICILLSAGRGLAKCKPIETISSSGGYREVTVANKKLSDVDGFKVSSDLLFYATSPVYGKPEVGVVDCNSGDKTILVKATNIDKAYPEGANFFRLKSVEKKSKDGPFIIMYFESEDVDKTDFKNFEIEKNLKTFVYKK